MCESLSNIKLDVLFFIKKTKLLKNEEAPICMRITVNSQRAEIMIKRSILPNKWNQPKERVNGNEPALRELNNFIEVSRNKVFKVFRQLEMDGRPITAKIISDILQGREDPDKPKTLIEIFTEHNKQVHSLVGIDYAEVTAKKFDTSLLRLKEYLSYQFKVKDIKITDVDNPFIRNYDIFLKTQCGCHHNSALKHLKNLKKIVRIAMANGWVRKDPFFGIKFIEQETHIEFLTKEELNVLINKEFDLPQHNQVRDIFVFCCFTGLAFADVKTLKPEHIKPDYVLVAQNKVSQIEDILHLDNTYYFKKYPFIYDFINMSIIKKDSKKERNMDYFDAMIAEMLDKTQIVGAILPGFYGKIKEAIETSYKGKPIISLSEFHQYCNSMLEEPINEEQCKYLTSYLKQIGIILWNQKNPEVVYINKKWIIRNIYKVLEELSVKKGEFDLQHVIQSIEGIHKEKDAADLIQIMLDFTMIFQHPYCNKYIAPLYLPTIPDELINMFVDKNARAYRRIKYSGFIHKHIILSFFHKYSKLIWGNTEVNKSSYYYWKDAIIIKDPATSEIVMIQFHLGGNDGNASIDITKLNIYVPTSFADDIVKYLHEINTGYETEEMVTGNGTNYVPLSVIYENEEKENYTFLYNNKYYKLGDFKQYLKKTNQMKKIFISYSKQDLTIVNRFTDHLAALRQDGKIAHWYCSELLAGSEWDAEIKRHFDEADIICFMISHNFMRTQYIHEHEIARAFERKNENSNLKIIPIILDFCRWTTEKNNLGNFTALPYTAKPVADFQNENMAWYIIEECLRLIIDQDIKDTDQSLYTNAGLPMDIRKIYERMTDGSVDKNSK